MAKAGTVSAHAAAIEDIAALARMLAEREPYRSASGPDALLALAAHLDQMTAGDAAGRQRAVRVEVRKKRSG